MYYEVDFSEFFTLQLLFGVIQFFVNVGHGIENRFFKLNLLLTLGSNVRTKVQNW